jgi:predicted nucleic acid-binding Zn ribbon protein
MVQCGFCGKQFSALDSLHDRPVQGRAAPGQLPDGNPEHQDEPQFEIPAGTGGGRVIPAEFADYPQIDPLDQVQADELASELLETEPVRRSRLVMILWYGGVLLLLLVISLQLLWFNRDSVLRHYPQYVPLAKQLCERLHCELIRGRDTGAIVLLNRDVRDHPRFNNVLLINVTIVSRSEHVQPYPEIQLVLYDTNGKITGYRRFKPVEYLDPSVIIDNGMVPQQPAHLVLEVTDTNDTAVSFEFHFL